MKRSSPTLSSVKLIPIDSENKYTKQDYYLSDNEFLKVASFSPLKNGLFFLSAVILDISAMFLFFSGGWLKIIVGVIFMLIAGYLLISRKELYITKEFIRRTYSLSCFGRKSRVWQYKVPLGDFSRLDISWPETKHTDTLKQKAQLSIHNDKTGESIDIMDFFIMPSDQSLLIDTKRRIERALGLAADAKRQE